MGLTQVGETDGKPVMITYQDVINGTAKKEGKGLENHRVDVVLCGVLGPEKATRVGNF